MSTGNGPGRDPKIAVALNYDGSGAPTVTAKGRDDLADRILELARMAAVPIEEEAGLAQALEPLPLGEEIPEALFVAVAEVLAFAYMASGRTPPSSS